ncbi:MAG: hypothetical protein ACYTFO_01590 [Planctomycetota bacterium]
MVGLLWAIATSGTLSLVTGVVALICSQPYHVYYPLVLGGGLLVIIPLSLLRTLRRRYAQIELRKMSAMDAG